nr:MAG TPA: hypothetical protein [Caudoviricetes sp.]
MFFSRGKILPLLFDQNINKKYAESSFLKVQKIFFRLYYYICLKLLRVIEKKFKI